MALKVEAGKNQAGQKAHPLFSLTTKELMFQHQLLLGELGVLRTEDKHQQGCDSEDIFLITMKRNIFNVRTLCCLVMILL